MTSRLHPLKTRLQLRRIIHNITDVLSMPSALVLTSTSGEMTAKPGNQFEHSHKITDWKAFRTSATRLGGKPRAEMDQSWPAEISEEMIGQALQRISFTRKSDISTPKET
jgi:hypothetical protein